jgi:hypothetical protein
MATATKKYCAGPGVPRHGGSAATTILTFQDYRGSCCWTVLGTGGESLPRSGHDEGTRIERLVLIGPGSAQFEASDRDFRSHRTSEFLPHRMERP